MINRAGLTQEAYGKMTDTLEHTLKRLWQQVKMVAVSFGENLKPEVEAMSLKFEKLNEDIDKFIENNGRAILQTIKWTGIILLSVIALEKLMWVMRGIIAATTWLTLHPAGAVLVVSAGLVMSWKNLGLQIGRAVNHYPPRLYAWLSTGTRLDRDRSK